MCSADGSVNTTIIDLACQQIKDVSQEHQFWNQLYTYCLLRLNWLVAEMVPTCQDIERRLKPTWIYHTKSCSGKEDIIFIEQMALDCKMLGKSSYSRYESVLREIQFDMASELNTANVHVVTDSDITIINKVFLPVVEQDYQVQFNTTNNGLIHIEIKNNAFKKLFLHLDNSKGSINIAENLFIESGIKILRDIEYIGQATAMQGNVFEGKYRRPVLEIRNTENISLKGNTFKNLKFAYQNSQNEEKDSGILCSNSELKIFGCSFKRVEFNTVLHLKNCSVEMKNTSVRENTRCIHLWKGELMVHNSSFIENEIPSPDIANELTLSDSMINVQVSHILLDNVVVVNNRGPMMRVNVSTGDISSSRWLQNRGHGDLLWISDSHFAINDSFFVDNFKEFDFTLLIIWDNSTVSILRSNFTFNEARLIHPEIHLHLLGTPAVSSVTPLLGILSCRFQGNIARKDSLVRATKAIVVFENCEAVDNNVYEVGGGFLYTVLSRVYISNCRFANNSASENAGVIYIVLAGLIVQNTVFENNSCGNDGGTIYADEGGINLKSSTFSENRSFGSDGGAICLDRKSNLVSKNCTFSGNNAAMEGGAVMVTDRSTFEDFASLFLSNTASNYGKYMLHFYCYCTLHFHFASYLNIFR